MATVSHARASAPEMAIEVEELNEWIPEQMPAGTIYVLENAGDVGDPSDPFWAVLACPQCGELGLVTQKQVAGLLPIICGSEECSAQFFIRDRKFIRRLPS